ncbi:YlmC/YmxH family sporulation protein [Clostridium thermarum]|uniref:YlmC/YmxH family sporulation protein n=1 Tax=Clostridium thermarum TaxID=1716543 RepID=UPI0011204F60|nr:YlmC/YmxH family sporulation protein [Clostridium thermarum]
MYSINNLRVMEVIDINTGAKIGYIKDIKIDCDEYRIESLLLPMQKSSWFGKQNMLEIPWSKVKKVGIDVILVDADSTAGAE